MRDLEIRAPGAARAEQSATFAARFELYVELLNERSPSCRRRRVAARPSRGCAHRRIRPCGLHRLGALKMTCTAGCADRVGDSCASSRSTSRIATSAPEPSRICSHPGGEAQAGARRADYLVFRGRLASDRSARLDELRSLRARSTRPSTRPQARVTLRATASTQPCPR